MKVIRSPELFRDACTEARASAKRVAIVPTMGALHDGHMAIVSAARERADFVAVSIFVNPTQFGPNEDLDRYPRTFDADAARCSEAGVDVVFAPDTRDIYPPGDQTRVRVGEVARALCGAHRPGHFEGVATVVTKLLALTGPCLALFGRKDYQQLQVIRRLVRDLMLPAEIIGVPTVREPDGLALSSRNRYLDAPTRERALAIARALSQAVAAFERGERRAGALRELAAAPIVAAADRVDYVEIADPDAVEPFAPEALVGERALLAAAARFGATRLIDNVVLGEDPPPLGQAGAR